MLARLYPFAQKYPAGVQDIELDLSIHDGQLHLIYRVQADDGCIVCHRRGQQSGRMDYGSIPVLKSLLRGMAIANLILPHPVRGQRMILRTIVKA